MNLGTFDFIQLKTFERCFDMAAVHRPISGEGLMPYGQVTYGLLGELMEIQFLSVRLGKEVIKQSVTHFGHDQT